MGMESYETTKKQSNGFIILPYISFMFCSFFDNDLIVNMDNFVQPFFQLHKQIYRTSRVIYCPQIIRPQIVIKNNYASNLEKVKAFKGIY
jgi:hypothetical protein